MQTILGSGGAIGESLARELRTYTTGIRLVSRHPDQTDPDNECFPADLTDLEQVCRAVEGSKVAYLTAGLPYDHKVWAATWPRIIDNVIKACAEAKARLVFFDNIYMYDPSRLNPMTEATPIGPTSRKGKVRAAIAQALLDAHREGHVEALIARSADFYGPGVENVSILTETVFKPLSQGKKANWLGRDDKKHSFTYVPDAARATALLGNTPSAFGQVWHLPTAPHPYTGRQWVEHIAAALGTKPAYRVAGKGLVRLLGLFMPIMRETVEMLYQYDRDYVFDSRKFETAFDFSPTPYEEGIRNVIQAGFQ
jgi:nucleoside-diphosphate-sugar epimerase